MIVTVHESIGFPIILLTDKLDDQNRQSITLKYDGFHIVIILLLIIIYNI